ncbi:MAG: zinc metallopeptidase [Anaerolineae bacterium]
MFFFDPLYFMIALPGLLLALWAQWRVNSAYSKYGKIANGRNMTGEQVAQFLLQKTGLAGTVNIAGTPGNLTDHYDPRDRTLYLSYDVAKQPSVAAMGIVAHEVGHAMQHAEAYGPLQLRMAIVPAVNIGSRLGFVVFFIGFILAAWIRVGGGLTDTLIWLGVFMISGTALFSLLTLPVELNASSRAKAMLAQVGLVQGNETGEVKSVLDAAAMTYVAAAASSILTLLYYVLLAGRVTGRRR